MVLSVLQSNTNTVVFDQLSKYCCCVFSKEVDVVINLLQLHSLRLSKSLEIIHQCSISHPSNSGHTLMFIAMLCHIYLFYGSLWHSIYSIVHYITSVKKFVLHKKPVRYYRKLPDYTVFLQLFWAVSCPLPVARYKFEKYSFQ